MNQGQTSECEGQKKYSARFTMWVYGGAGGDEIGFYAF